MIRLEQEALILSFPRAVRVLSWAMLNGGFCHADHIVNQQVHKNDATFAKDPGAWLHNAVRRLGLQGKVVGMATAVKMESCEQVSVSSHNIEVTCFATVGPDNALAAGDSADQDSTGGIVPAHTINMILLIKPGLSEGAMVEAIQIATEGRIRALQEAKIPSKRSGLPATGTGTDCIAIASLDQAETPYCGKHTKIGELVATAAYSAVKRGLAKNS